MKHHAEAKITVQSSNAEPYDQTAGPALLAISLTETFAGDIEGESTVRALQVAHGDKSASLVSLQRFRGTLGGHRGTAATAVVPRTRRSLFSAVVAAIRCPPVSYVSEPAVQAAPPSPRAPRPSRG